MRRSRCAGLDLAEADAEPVGGARGMRTTGAGNSYADVSEASDSRGGGAPHDGNRDVRAVKAIAAMTFAIQLARFIKTQEPAQETPRPKKRGRRAEAGASHKSIRARQEISYRRLDARATPA